MKQIYHFSDQLGSVDCIPCPEKNHSGRYNRDHIPTKALLNRPYPENLMPVGMCKECNSGFAKDEEYFSAFIASVISGSTKPDPLQFPTAFRILARNPRLRSRIDADRRIEATPGKEPVVIWTPELERIERVIVKNARGHVLFELGQAIELPPFRVNIAPIEQLFPHQLSQFEHPQGPSGWPEVASRLMLRLLETGEVGEGGWINVQNSVYRYAVDESPRVRIVLREYLAAEVSWDECCIPNTLKDWERVYDTFRPHHSLDGRNPAECLIQYHPTMVPSNLSQMY